MKFAGVVLIREGSGSDVGVAGPGETAEKEATQEEQQREEEEQQREEGRTRTAEGAETEGEE